MAVNLCKLDQQQIARKEQLDEIVKPNNIKTGKILFTDVEVNNI